MVKGCNKRVIVLKDTQSDIVEEAYFILKEQKNIGSDHEIAFIDEANRIIEKSSLGASGKAPHSTFKTSAFSFSSFLAGAFSSLLVGTIIYCLCNVL